MRDNVLYQSLFGRQARIGFLGHLSESTIQTGGLKSIVGGCIADHSLKVSHPHPSESLDCEARSLYSCMDQHHSPR